MRKFLFLSLFTVACNLKEPDLNGAYESVRVIQSDSLFSGSDIKIFKNGFWISASFDESSLFACSGGIYKIGSGKCLQTIHFHSHDSAVIDKTDTLNYDSKGNKFWIEELRDNDNGPKQVGIKEYIKITAAKSLKNSLLEGVWKLNGRQIGNVKNFDDMEDGANIVEVKIYTYPFVSWAQYNFKRKRFIGAGGGTYQFDGDTLTERYQYMTYPVPPGTELKHKITKISSTELQQKKFEGTFKENWNKME